jgi:hydroxyethylthiazole kinase-like uncharacterized protein yjeF
MNSMREVQNVPRLPARPASGHKGTFGTVAIVAGRDGMLGAAILCARSALRGGAGLVRLLLDDPLLRAAAAVGVPGATARDRSGDPAEWLAGARAVAVGPGLGTDDRGAFALDGVLGACGDVGCVVVDADALNLLAERQAVAWAGPPAVFTPHPGEAARLLGTTASDVQADRIGAVVELARRSGAVCVLKGAGTLVCDGERLFRNTTGNPGLGTGGSGDVLTGLIAALAAQGLSAFDAACLGVHVHGAAADAVVADLSQPGLIAEDLPDAIARSLRDHGGAG